MAIPPDIRRKVEELYPNPFDCDVIMLAEDKLGGPGEYGLKPFVLDSPPD